MNKVTFHSLPYLFKKELTKLDLAILDKLTADEDDIYYPVLLDFPEGKLTWKANLKHDEVLKVFEKADLTEVFERVKKEELSSFKQDFQVSKIAPVAHMICQVWSLDGKTIERESVLLTLEDWLPIVKLVMDKDEYTMSDLKPLLPEKKYARLVSRHPNMENLKFITIPDAERIASELQPEGEVCDEICSRDDGNGNQHHLVADIMADGIEIHGEAIVDGDIEQTGSILVDNLALFHQRLGVYKPASIMRLLAMWGEEGDATLDVIKEKLRRRRIIKLRR